MNALSNGLKHLPHNVDEARVLRGVDVVDRFVRVVVTLSPTEWEDIHDAHQCFVRHPRFDLAGPTEDQRRVRRMRIDSQFG